MLKSAKKILFLLVLSLMFVVPVFAVGVSDFQGPLDNVVSKTGGLQENANINTTLGNVVKIALGLVGSVFFILMFYAGYNWMVARGEEEKIKKSQNTIIAAMIGLFIIVGAYAISNTVLTKIIAGTGTGDMKVSEDNPSGCCLDKVAACTDAAFVQQVNIPMWAWRITTKSDCQKQGANPDPSGRDCFYGEEDEAWNFFPNQTAEECKLEYNKK